MNATLRELETPALVLDEAKFDRDVARAREHSWAWLCADRINGW